ncbi:E3 ubiquitin-protein ligase MYCBP2 isoform X13 [Manacus candei]|uniref:E3 ubiquitin-protein ligase MYCBP2 isoform X13 n=1 Tax=Manacus candei TaxID=415023 RepID=UPI00222612D2|nr:E3 ubiquitin-protein ligase MYCBP2 isoform X13 [Manacus candei]
MVFDHRLDSMIFSNPMDSVTRTRNRSLQGPAARPRAAVTRGDPAGPGSSPAPPAQSRQCSHYPGFPGGRAGGAGRGGACAVSLAARGWEAVPGRPCAGRAAAALSTNSGGKAALLVSAPRLPHTPHSGKGEASGSLPLSSPPGPGGARSCPGARRRRAVRPWRKASGGQLGPGAVAAGGEERGVPAARVDAQPGGRLLRRLLRPPHGCAPTVKAAGAACVRAAPGGGAAASRGRAGRGMSSAAAAAASAGAAAACAGAERGFSSSSGGAAPAMGPMGPEDGSAGGLGALPAPPLGCRSRYQLLLSGKALADRYRRIYTAALSDRELGSHPGRSKKLFSKKKLKRKQKTKLKVKTRNKTENLESTITIPDIRLHSNPSAFNVYCNVRHCVLEWQKKEASVSLASKNSVQSGDSDSDEEEESKEPPIKLPKIIEVGLCEVFELIKETRFSHPSLCLRSLQALLNVLQGQQPEGLQSEPPEVLESLFQLLLEITVRSTGMNDSTGQSLTALSCACLFSLVAAWGETGRTLQAISAILTNNGSHACQTIQVPTILNSLQRSVQAVLVGKIQIQDWFSNGIKKAALMHKWPLKEISVDDDDQCLLQSDGFFLYLLCKDGLYKIGSGYSGTVRGHIYNSTSRIKNRKEKKSWLGYAQGYLLYRDANNHSMTAIRINPETLEQDGTVALPDCHTEGQNILFTDGEYINQIAASRDDGFVVRIFATSTEPVLQQELQLKLARKCLHACGISLFDLEKDLHIISTGFDEESAVLGAGREFALMKTASGKIYYTGKYQSLGIKQGGPSAGKWVELPITKSPKIIQFSVGHDGSHALLVAEDGSIFFTGSASKGEDGESTKSRRQSKPYKPKKIIKMEGKIVISTACNNGSSSVISKDGELYMFGKDAIYSDSTSLVTDLKGHFVTQVAMGKAHTCVLMKNGEVWTFGVNNKGQCGRDTGSMSQGGKGFGVENMATAMDEDLEEELDEKDEKSMMCPPGMHKWKLEQCMVCTVCGDCTGYGASCVSSGRPDRVPGGICGCGSGESGCAVCGCCKACARELDGQEARQRGILDAVKEMIPLDLLLAVPVPGVNIEEHLQLRQEEKRQRVNRRHRLEEGRGPLVFPGPIFMNHREQALARIRPHPAQLKHKRDKHKDGSGERGEKDASKITTYPPGAVRFDCELRAVQVSCGFHHSVVLMENGDVYTFGYGQHGQLGHGDVNSRGCPTLVQALPGPSTQVTAGSNHTAILLMDGQVFTFGSFSKGQLGRPILDMPYWNAKPAPMPNIGSKYGRKATWIGASGDQTFLRIDEALINSHVLATSEIFASRHIIGLVPASISEPPPFKCLLINKVDGSCKTFNDSEQEDLQGSGVCLDPVYDVIWRFRPNARELWSYNAVVADSRLPSAPDIQSRCSILSPELALPTGSKALTTRSHAALHILGCLDTLAAMQDLKMGVANTEEETQAVMKVYSKEDYSVVNRFESHGGGWGYSAHSVEAIRFCADTDILLGGLGLFGGRGEYTAKIKLFELGPDGGDHETDGDLLAETDVLAYDCAAREKYAMMFDEPVLLQAGWWYVAWARVSGPSSDCGSHGQASITTDDGVVFQFKSSKKSNNGTDVNAGQIPQLLYRLPTSDGSASKGKQQTSEPVHILKRSFARTVSVECFESLLSILHWSWTTLVLGVEELRGLKGFQYTATLLDLERLRFVGTCCLRLLRVYTCEIYPISASAKAVVEETSKLADCIGKTRTLLRKILSEGVDHCMVKLDNDPQGYLSQPLSLLEAVLQECHNTFTACFHSFYPTPALQWACLCDLLNCLDQDIQEANFKTSSSRLLAAVMSALCHTSVKLTSIFPIAYDGEALLRSMVKQVSTENDSALAHRFPLLVAHMEKLSQSEENVSGMTSFREVLEKMLVIVVLPVRNSLRRENELFSSHLVSNTCGLLASIVSELTASALGSEVDGLNSLHSVKSTPNRFTKTSQGRSWNTGNGSPDAICFSVDKAGIVVVGFSVYGGGGIHEYELEVLVDDSDHTGDATHSHRWTSLELVKGTYTTDDSPSDIAEIRLDKVVPLKENVKYAVRLRNYGSRTANGDGGMTTVQCPDGVTFTFSTCSLSSNGTNQTRGQIPQILYYRSEYDGDLQSQLLNKANEEDKNCSRALSVVSAVVRAAKDLLHRALAVDAEDIPELLSSSSLFSMLLPLIIAYIGPVAAAIPKVAVEVFGLVQQLLPSVAVLNQKYAPPAFNPNQSTDSTTGNQPEQGLSACTTSNHYAVVESEHPYKPASVTHYKVTFPECVRWITIEFDTQCGTAQSEDVLRLLIPVRIAQSLGFGPKHASVHENLNSWIELKKFSGSSGWPTMVLVLPGNEALFSLETASDYVKDEKACFYGFKCYAIGYEFSPGSDEGIIQLEKELANLGGSCAAALMKKDLALPIAGNEFEEDLEIVEEAALQVCKSHSGILGKGLALSHSPTILEALEGSLPLQVQSNEQSFLEDFIACVPGSSGGRLARWLQPDSYADPQKTSLILNKDDIRCGWPTVITVQTKDQYGDVVHVPNMKVEVKAIPVSQKKTSLQQEQVKKVQRIPGSPATAASPSSDMTFGGLPSPKLDSSYEPMIVKEARYIAITMMKAYENYSFEELRFASPTPKRPSENMLIRVNNDGTYCANWTPGAVGLYTIHVTIDGIEIDAGLEVKVKDPPKGMIPPGTQLIKPKAEPQPNKVTNSEGTWVQMDKNSMVEFCESDEGEAWSLARDRGGNQYLRHEDEQVLLDQNVQTPPPSPFSIQAFSKGTSCSNGQGFDYGLGNNKGDQLSAILNSIQSRPNLPAPSIFDQAAKPPSSLVHSPFVFGQPLSFQQPQPQLQSDRMNFTGAARPVSPAGKTDTPSKHRADCRSPKLDVRMNRAVADQKKPRNTEGLSASECLILKSDAAKLRSDSHSRSLSPNHNTLQTLKTDGRTTTGLRAESPGPGTRSSSPKTKTLTAVRSGASSPRSSSPHDKTLPQKPSSPVKTKLDPPRERSKSDSYTLDPDTLRKKKVPLTEPLRGRSTSPKPKIIAKDGKPVTETENRAPSPHVVQENLHSEVVEVCTSSTLKTDSITDTTCEDNTEFRSLDDGSNKVHFSIGKAPLKDEQDMRASPKVSRKCAGRHTRPKKEKSNFLFKGDGSKPVEPAKQAMSPSVAECARAVFAAFLWHEGIVHDAMACSSFLKFNPELSKEHAPIRSSLTQQPAEEKETKLKNRHSLEISSALNMFNISPHGPDISKMGSINKNKVLSMLKEPPLHEKCEDGKTETTSFETSGHHTIKSKSPLPLTLQHLVAFWEDISLATIKAASQNMIFPSPGSCAVLKKKESDKDNKKAKKEKKKKEKVETRPRGNLFGEMAQLAVGGPEKDTICELCGESHPYPVTYHMRQAHPGCGRYAGGQGYNSIGHFCGGWAGNCGDGGIGGSTWYLVCDRCREKYLREKQAAAREKIKQSRRKPMQVKTPRALPTMEAHQVIKANALYLLSLSSAAEPSILCYHPAKAFQSQLPSLKEGISEDFPIKMPCLYLQTLARHHHENFVGYQDDNLFQDEMRYLRSTSVPAPYISVTPDASPNVFEEPESNMKSMPPSLETSPITDTDLAKRTVFQRSYSVVASEYDKQHSILPARVKAIPRRRVNSGDAEVGSSLLRHPSPELSRLISAHSSLSKGERNFQWPVLAFVIQHHDLEGLEIAMKQALRKSACRVFAMEAFNWLLCNVIQTTSLHDILWHFVASLTPAPVEPEEEEDEENKSNKENAEQEKDTRVCEHPLSDIVIAGEAAHPLPHTFHRLLQTISDLMMSLPSGSALQQMALRCWSLKFKQSDHQFLHQSNVFHHINNILSKSDDGDSEESFSISVQSGFEVMNQELCIVVCLKDLTSIVDIKTSSRPAMIGSLTDGSTETFWESGDEDKNKTKNITINCVKGINARYVCVHVDNSRDLGNKVTSMTFLTGKAVEDLCRIKQVDLDSRHIGWVTSELPGGDNHIIKIELKGPENTLRVRQVKILGWKDGESIKIAGQISASVAQQRNCESETLRVFRLITSQVFGKLISGDAEPTPEQEEKALLSSPEGEEKVHNATSDADLKEHMVGIIFSRSKLTNLQKQVCAHIVQAIRMEATRVREEWEHAISSKENANSQPNDEDASSDAYCFELLSMVLALSGSNVGRQYLAQQLTLLQDLFSLLHTASPRVQRQVTSLLRRVLPEVTPSRLASIIGVKSLPPADISDIIHSTEKGDWNKLGILDMFLGCIAKALTVQLKAKGTTITGTAGTTAGKGVTTVTLPMIFNSSYIRRGESHWWMKGSTPTQISEIIIKLIKDMAAGHLSEAWSRVTKNAIAETIIALTKMEEEYRSPVRCIATTRLWLALASLCVLDQDHVDRLSSGRWMGKDGQQKQMPMCDNHDDGETAAIILCNVCGNLCTDCDRFLHLHRRTKTHQRQVFKEEEEAIKVDLHEGCGRTKLFWLMALADSKTMKAMVEFREQTGKPTTSSSEACRFCGCRSGTELSAVGSVCSDADCQEYAKIACSKTHPCGHPCGGVKNEEHCLPCLHGCDKNATTLKQDADDMCMICFTEALSAAPAIQLDCSHVFHLQCCQRVLENRWLGPRITFGFMSCPICKNKINHTVLKDLLDPIKELYEDVRRKALMRLEYEGLHKSEAITTPGVRFYNDPAGYAMNRYAYYVCYKCKKAYFGGEARCDAEAGQGDDYDPRELICGACSDVSRAQMCPKHGTDFLEYKCRYCCSVAVFFCFGTTHFCNACHDDFQRMTSIPKEELPHCPAGPKGKQLEGTECPLHVVHPPTGEEFALGCGVCRNAHTF